MVGLTLGLSLVSYLPEKPAANYVGNVGYVVSDLMISGFGLASYCFPALLVLAALALFIRGATPITPLRVVGGVFSLAVASVALGLARSDAEPGLAGGWIGGFLATLMHDAFGVGGSTVILAAIGLLVFIMLTGVAPSVVLRQFAAAVAERFGRVWAALREYTAMTIRGLRETFSDMTAAFRRGRAERASVVTAPIDFDPPVVFGGDHDPSVLEVEIEVEAQHVGPIVQITSRPEDRKSRKSRKDEVEQEEFLFDIDDSDYRLPPVRLLGKSDERQEFGNEKQLISQSKILEQKLATFSVSGRVTAVRPGPVITTYEFEPDAGIKVSRVVNLCDDLTMAMRAHGVRIVAPIPGKNVVGIEVSNRSRALVGLRDMVANEEFQEKESKLWLALGRDTTGHAVYADLARMPHLLMAGATGAGKSVALNTMILSILYKATPRDVRFIMIDPKMLELALYEGIPHLLVPVVTDVKKASSALINVMREMDRRFEAMKDLRVRNLDDYNMRVAELEEEEEGEEEEYEVEEYEEGEEDDGEYEEGDEDEEQEDDEYVVEGEEEEGFVHEHLPRIVLIIDELADLMMTVGREIEESITRLAQKARAAGIHLIVATQRPSVDVITGLIKANFPSRVSFQVTSRPDSRTILDSIGAERLLGMGDMLFMAPTTSFLQRLHGPYISDREIAEVVEFVKKQGDPDYHMELLEAPGGEDSDSDEGDEFFDELYDRCVDLITEHGQGSTSWLQRKLSIGYNRAARIMEHMEREGVVGPAEGSRPRKVIAQAMQR